ncbi:hypothetical protein [Leptolyngbya sp. FACHB-261]|uniref:hypothetical protein n=1 Tax=Leptolyngbya sp. FACHB-261 TaxID=2692806 RepID=UPI001681EA38|nr:hypothetical protein [Leptolyngbya sp. FACHB-261]MBD2099562.1 hypothetical protein [Leptolyngbya sp. FACHB-261]
MASQKRKFNAMSYHEVQRANSRKRAKLRKEDQQWLRDNSYRNVGWDNVVNLFQKIQEFLDKYELEELTLGELFLEADRIGNKYITNREIQEFNQRLSEEVNEIAEEVDRQFPDIEVETIDFSTKADQKARKKRNQKSYGTVRS